MRRVRLLDLYTAPVILAGFAVLGWALLEGRGDIIHSDELAFWIFAAAVVFGEFFPIRVPGHVTELAISTTFIFALLLTYGPETAIVVQAVASGLADLHDRKPPRRALFNVAQYTLAWGAAGLVVESFIDLDAPASEVFAAGNLPVLLLASAVFFAVNSLLVRTAVAIALHRPLLDYWRRDLAFRAWTTAMLMALAPPVCVVQDIDLLLSLLIVLPVLAIHRAATEAARNEYLATHDDLTGLPNRVLFRQYVADAIADPDRPTFAVVLMDLDRFKDINDTLGHHQGDALLERIPPRLAAVVGDDVPMARLGGDEFALVLPWGAGPADAVQAAERVREAFHDGFEVEGIAIDVGASMGVALYPDHGADPDSLMKGADVAMYRAKDAGSGVELYHPANDHHSIGHLAMARELRLAVGAGELTLHYQPKLHLATGEVREVEALVRWAHPRRGMVAPGEFIPLAEKAHLMLPLTSFVLAEALGQVRRWRDQGLELTVAINLSPRSLMDGGLADEVALALERFELPAAALVFEITESAIMADAQRAGRSLEQLREMGVRLSIDDFGTGYSSLSYLKRLPVDEVKIDRSFVSNMVSDPDDGLIVRSTVELTRGLGRTAVAEGVEDQITLDLLRSLGCDMAQGFHISRPLPPAELTEWLRSPTFTATAGSGRGGRVRRSERRLAPS